MIKTFSKDHIYKVGDKFNKLCTKVEYYENNSIHTILRDVTVYDITDDIIWVEYNSGGELLKFYNRTSFNKRNTRTDTKLGVIVDHVACTVYMPCNQYVHIGDKITKIAGGRRGYGVCIIDYTT